MDGQKFVIGLDYGTDSVRALIVDAVTGKEVASAVEYYSRWAKAMYCDSAKSQYRQHPLDYLESLENAVKNALKQSPAGTAENVVGVSFDTTGSTPVFINKEGTPLAMLPEFAENPNAMFILWKDHTAIAEADEINKLAAHWKTNYVQYEGGIYSSEWVWAKALHVLREDEKVREAAYSWVEHCDWMPAILTGNTKPEELCRSRCAAGHKAMWHADWQGLPPEEFLVKLDPILKGFRERLFSNSCTADKKVGYLTEEWAKRLGLTTKVAVGAGAFDCHMGAVGGEISPNALVRVMGTSTCDILISDYDEMKDKLVNGICGQVDGSVVPGYVGLEAGQSAFGDVYAWFRELLAWPIKNLVQKSKVIDEKTKTQLIGEMVEDIIPTLADEAAKIPYDSDPLLATDWFNGRRTPDANQKLKATITGLHLGSSTPHVFKALVEATAFGSKAIVDRFIDEGVAINEVIAIGGVAKKSDYVMQILADVLNMPIKVASSDQACALGAAMFATVVADVYSEVSEAQEKMKQGFDSTYTPNPDRVDYYKKKYENYVKLGISTENLY